jgi:hypothetical protein
MRRKNKPVDLREIYGPEEIEAFKQQIHRFFVEHLESVGWRPEESKGAEIVQFPTNTGAVRKRKKSYAKAKKG